MAEQPNVTATQKVGNPEVDSARALEELKAKVDDLTKQNQDLLEAKHDYYDAVLNSNAPAAEEEHHRTSQEIRADLRGYLDRDVIPTNLQYCSLVLELDDAERRAGKPSIFLPEGHQVGTIKPEEYQTADNFHDVLADCVERAEGDPDAFNILLNRRIKN